MYPGGNLEGAAELLIPDKESQELRLISIPSIFYGSSIKKGSVSLKFFMSGSKIAELRDDKKNGATKTGCYATTVAMAGTLTESGSVGGVVLYEEGFIVLTGSWRSCQSSSRLR